MVLHQLDVAQPQQRNVSALTRRVHRRGETHIRTPTGRGPWVPDSDCDSVGLSPLSEEARVIRRIALIFPQFQAPGKDELYQLQRDMQELSGSKYRAFGINRVQAALNELRDRGFYGWRKTTTGRPAKGTRPEWAYVRSYSNEPWGHLEALKALNAEQIRMNYRAAAEIWGRYLDSGALPAPFNVVSLAEHRLSRAS
jgi:hypothetical protein